MTRLGSLRHEFVDVIPKDVESGVLYVSVQYGTAVHKCCCGCGKEVVTPITPTDWKLTFDGETVSLDPSIGSWSLECQSHYWIENNRVKWARRWTREEIDRGRAHDRWVKEKYFDQVGSKNPKQTSDAPPDVGKKPSWLNMKKWWSQREG